ncbi:uncharacterized protein [Desmodus rotundus]|uniref:uncharacterized protein isoform X3 n=1 Tax=Desmodus rotundus TaxID=9430 RepID=UPI0039E376D6
MSRAPPGWRKLIQLQIQSSILPCVQGDHFFPHEKSYRYTNFKPVSFSLQGSGRVFKMEMAMAELEPEKATRCEPVASRRRAPDFRRSGGGRAGGPEEVCPRLGGGGCG